MNASAASPLNARVIETRADGSALVEVPVIVVTDELDLSRTSGGGKGTVAITASDLAEMVANFREWPKPVAVGFDGLDGHQDERGGPQLAFINSVRIDGGALYAVVEVSATAAALVPRFRGFSMEARKNPKTPTKSLAGWVLTGGIFTNNPATDTQFRIAATDGEKIESDETGVHSAAFNLDPERAKENEMAEQIKAAPGANEDKVSLSFHEAALGEVKAKLTAATETVQTRDNSLSQAREEVRTLTAKVEKQGGELQIALDDKATAVAKANRLETQVKSATQAKEAADIALTEMQERLTTAENANLDIEVKTIQASAIAKGVAPAYFDGCDSSPAEWMKANYASLEAFKTQTDRAIALASSTAPTAKPTASGADPSKKAGTDDTDSDGLVLTEEKAFAKYGPKVEAADKK